MLKVMKTLYSKERPSLVDFSKNRIRDGITGEWKEVTMGYLVNVDIHETTEEEIMNAWNELYEDNPNYDKPDKWFIEAHRYAYNQISVPMGKWKYDEVVSAIIRDKYREDEMEAITNNLAAVNAMFFQTLVSEGIVGAIQYLRDSYKSDDTERFKEMQEWRALAKREAREIFKI